MRALARWGALPLLVAPFGAWALGLGDIELRSTLNQPFNANIALVSATPEELEGLRVSLASPDTFARYGLERPAFLSALDFTVTRDASGRDVVRVSSRQAMTEPFVTLLVEASWSRGRLLREYTVLLDPPVLLPSQAAPAPVQPAESFAPQPGAGAVDRPAAAAPAPQPAAPAVQPPAAQPAPAPAPQLAAGTYGPVQRAETLWSIASQLQPQGVTLNQMMVALYEANPNAFDGNMNMLRAGAVLRIPETQTLTARSATAAQQEFARHLDDWRAGAEQQARLRLVAPGEEPAPAAAAVSGAAAAGAPAAEVARLQDQLSAAQAELDESRRLLQIRNEELAALQRQLAADEQAAQAETPSVDAVPAPAPGVDLELQSEPLFADELVDEAAADEAAAAAAAAEQTPAAADEPVQAVTPTPEPARPVVAQPPVAEPSLLDRAIGLMTSPFLLIGLGVLAVLGALVWFLRARRSGEDDDVTGRWDALTDESDDDLEGSTGSTERLRRQFSDDSIVVEERGGRDTRRESVAAAAAAAAAGVAAGAAAGRRDGAEAGAEETPEDTLSSHTVINLEQTDLLAEADFHMAYGLYDQAAELVSRGLEQSPERRDLKLKLLEVFFVWGNKDAFLNASRALHDEIGDARDPDWDKVVIMGKQICPDEPMFASATAAAGEIDMPLEAGGDSLDFTFDDQEAEVDLDFGASTGSDIEFRLDDNDATGSVEVDIDDLDGEDHSPARGETVSDFESLDIGERTAAGLRAAILSADDDDDDDAGDAGSRTSTDIDELAATQESPTIESPSRLDFDFDDDATAETVRPDAPTVETPTLKISEADISADAPTMETPTLETPRPGAGDATMRFGAWQGQAEGDDASDESESDGDATAWLAGMTEGTGELPTVEQPALQPDNSSDYTAEIDLDDLGLDVNDLRNLPDDFGDLPRAEGAETDTREQPQLSDEDADDELLSATGVTQVLGRGDDFEQQQTSVLSDDDVGLDDETLLSGTEVLPGRHEDDESGATSLVKALKIDQTGAGDAGLDLNLDDLSAALDGADTVEQPRAPEFSAEIFGSDGHTPLDLDVGADFGDEDEDPTGTEEAPGVGTETLTEVGTKLDLARAYIDMGDPEGARSILEEVLDEGDNGQRREARGLIDTLNA